MDITSEEFIGDIKFHTDPKVQIIHIYEFIVAVKFNIDSKVKVIHSTITFQQNKTDIWNVLNINRKLHLRCPLVMPNLTFDFLFNIIFFLGSEIN